MKTKLHLGIFILLLAFLGTYLEQTTAPNQQIVIQFSDEDIDSEDAENAIEVIRERLQSIGVEHIQILENESGQLKITYYSDADVERIKDILSKDEGFKFAYQPNQKSSDGFPVNKTVKDYELNISEIQNSVDVNWDFERTEIVQLNQKSDQSYNPKVNASGEQITTEQSNTLIGTAIKVNNFVAIAIDNLSYKIPEVRAGPTAIGII